MKISDQEEVSTQGSQFADQQMVAALGQWIAPPILRPGQNPYTHEA
jgi:hypothetical protein